ncbi:hypothetical protein P154DRAFT_522531 [Amniculicola lignicola CBS 123094]|uniref:Uncharacterized protein n=1 Tax=Amniculicola lignicola CBS 123094 TaxID=1392246 RepID=A0A6A5WRZ2_9PLEO|nr:hypothetical protein P154DRAFT_522531 [Amniculicola lignicola CBS 123094]
MPPTQLSAIHPSPKRKRDPVPHIPLLNTTLWNTATPPLRGSPVPDSPRNAVADQLSGMTIQAIPMLPLTPTDDAVRKKPKLDMAGETARALVEKPLEGDSKSLDKSILDTSHTGNREADHGREIPATPQSGSQPQPQAQQPRFSSALATFAQPMIFGSPLNGASVQMFTAPKQRLGSKSRMSQPGPRNKSPSPPLSALTWKDEEITGHLVDPSTDPDDDGTGLNGIGFRPTPAIAYARAQKRRQQLMDWRAREARDARAKRSERRKRGVGAGTNSRESTVERESAAAKEVDNARRAVRFAI